MRATNDLGSLLDSAGSADALLEDMRTDPDRAVIAPCAELWRLAVDLEAGRSPRSVAAELRELCDEWIPPGG